MPIDRENEPPANMDVALGAAYVASLTPGARAFFQRAVREYAERLKREAENVESMEHTGPGPPEITAAHVEEARWVSLRRMRRAASRGARPALIRVGQLSMSALVGIGASNFAQAWGAVATVLGVLFGAMLVMIERELQRDS